MTATPENLMSYAEQATARRITESIDTVIHRINSCFNRMSGNVIMKLDAPVAWSMYGGWTSDLSVAEVVPPEFPAGHMGGVVMPFREASQAVLYTLHDLKREVACLNR